MTDTTEELVAALGMDEDEEALAKKFYDAIQTAASSSDRDQQAREFRVGVSDLGFCSERTRRMIDQQVPEDSDMMLAWLGTVIGAGAEEAYLASFPTALRQQTVTVRLEGDSGIYNIAGHPDLILPDDGILIDVKTDYGFADVRRGGPSQQQQFQRHCYAKGAWELGLFGDRSLAEVKVANVWIDRSGIERGVHVDMEPFDQDYVDHAAMWLDDVVYAYRQEEEARKEPPREMCAAVCGFYSVCREYDTDVAGLITHEDTVRRIEMYLEGASMERQGKALKKEAAVHLEGVSGFTETHSVRWTHINEAVIQPGVRKGYDRLDIRAKKKGK